MANNKNLKIKNGLQAGRYLGSNGTEIAGTNGPYGIFSTTLYTGDSTNSRQITNGIDLSGEGGMVITAPRSPGNFWSVADSERGATSFVYTNGNNAEQTNQERYGAFNSDGYTLGSSSANSYMNYTGYTYVSWTFRKHPKFFDVVTYTGNGIAGRTVGHNLGSVPGCIIVKRTDAARNWSVFHRSTTATHRLLLNDTAAAADDANYWDDTEPTETEFTLGTQLNVNASGGTYVAYLFAHDDASDSLIKCGSYTGNGSTDGPEIDLGFEPQWILTKRTDSSGYWTLVDAMRGMVVEGDDKLLYPHTTDAEQQSTRFVPSATGFQVNSTNGYVNANGGDYIYIAIPALVQAQTLDLSTGHTFSITPTEALDILFSNPPASGTATGFSVEVDNTGGYAITWPSSVKWHLGTAPTVTASKELYTFITTDGGTTYYGKKSGEIL